MGEVMLAEGGVNRENLGAHLAAEGADVPLVLRDFHLLDHLTQGGAITGAVFAHDPHLLGPFGLKHRHVRHKSPQFLIQIRLSNTSYVY